MQFSSQANQPLLLRLVLTLLSTNISTLDVPFGIWDSRDKPVLENHGRERCNMKKVVQYFQASEAYDKHPCVI